MFTPLLPATGYAGWSFLKSTQNEQTARLAQTPEIRNDLGYLNDKLSEPVSLDAFLQDSRLKRVAMTAYGLAGEEWKSGFIRKALTEAADSDSTFLARLNNRNYTAFAEAFAPDEAGMIRIPANVLADMSQAYVEQRFREAVGAGDTDLRLSLNFEAEISKIATSGSNADTILFRILGDVPVREVFETALNLPADFRKLPIERQAQDLGQRLQSAFGISDLTRLADAEVKSTVLRRFHAMRGLEGGAISATAPGATALTLLQSGSGLGAFSSQNLFMSLYR